MKKNTKVRNVAAADHDSSYIRAYEDIELLNKGTLRPVRIQLEVLKPELYLKALNITQTIVCFGSARVRPEKEAKAIVAAAKKELAKKPKSKTLQTKLAEAEGLLSLSKYYEVGREFAKLVVKKGKNRFAVVTGGGPGRSAGRYHPLRGRSRDAPDRGCPAHFARRSLLHPARFFSRSPNGKSPFRLPRRAFSHLG